MKLRSQANAWINENIDILTKFDMNEMEDRGGEGIHRQQISNRYLQKKKKKKIN